MQQHQSEGKINIDDDGEVEIESPAKSSSGQLKTKPSQEIEED